MYDFLKVFSRYGWLRKGFILGKKTLVEKTFFIKQSVDLFIKFQSTVKSPPLYVFHIFLFDTQVFCTLITLLGIFAFAMA